MSLDPDSYYQLFILAVFVIISALFTAAETSLITINKVRLRHMVSELNPRAILINKLMLEPEHFFDAIMIGDSLANISAAVVGTYLALSIWPGVRGLVYAIIFLTVVILVFGEVIPKTVAVRNPNKVSLLLIRPLYLLLIFFYPLVKLLNRYTRKFSKTNDGKSLSQENPVEEELINLVNAGQEEGAIHLEEETMIHGVFDFTDTVVKDVMVPRPDIIAIEKDATYQELLAIIKTEQFSRIPVFENNIDNILGVVHIKDLILKDYQGSQAFSLLDYLRQPFFIPETKKVNELFRAMKKEKIHMAIVLDEYGSTTGLVTLEDMIEEIMGDIQDEHDMEEPSYRRIDADTIEVNASLRIDEVNDKLGFNLENEEADTVGGLVFAELDRVPKKGDKISTNGIEFVVQEMDGHRIEKLLLTKVKKEEADQPAS
mgnify:CR=1 FL=1